MTETELTIRQMCDLFDVTPRTLRFYESKELLFPRRVGQKRLFSKRDRARVTLILRGKRFGFSLEEIRQLLQLYKADAYQITQITQAIDLAGDRLADLQARRDELTAAVKDLKTQIDEAKVVLQTALDKKNAAEKGRA